MRALALALVVSGAWSGSAGATSYVITFLGNKMAPAGAEKGIPSVTKILAKWKVLVLPAKGTCFEYMGLPAVFSDGTDKISALKTVGYKVQKSSTYLNLCTDPDTGSVTSGNFEINLVQGDSFTANYAVYTANGNVNNGQFISSNVMFEYVVNDEATQYYDVSSAPVAAFKVHVVP